MKLERMNDSTTRGNDMSTTSTSVVRAAQMAVAASLDLRDQGACGALPSLDTAVTTTPTPRRRPRRPVVEGATWVPGGGTA